MAQKNQLCVTHCTECGSPRYLKKCTVDQIRRGELSPLCPDCCNGVPFTPEARNLETFQVANCTTIRGANGQRCTLGHSCDNYLTCLDRAAEKNWPGWRVMKEKPDDTQ